MKQYRQSVLFLLALLSALNASIWPSVAHSQSNEVVLISEPGDYIGGGQTYIATNSEFSFSGGVSGISASAFGFNITLVAPGSEDLTVGMYDNAARWPFEGGAPGIDVSGNGRGCNQECGTYQILEIHTDSSGNIDRLWAKFTNICECFMAPLTGEIRYNSQLATALTPPVIMLQPESQAVAAGRNAAFTVESTGTAPITYQWLHNGTNIPGAVQNVLGLPNVQAAEGGLYSVTVTNAAGFTNSVAAQLTVVASPACVPVPPGLVSWWEGEGNTADAAGTNHGALIGGAGFAAGKVGTAFDFSNGSGYMQVADNPSLAFGASDFTVELWVSFVSVGGIQALVAKDEGPGQDNKWIFALNGGQLQFAVGDGSFQRFLGAGVFHPAPNEWHYVAVTRSGSLYSFYADGVLVSTDTGTTPIPAIAAPLTIGMAENLYYAYALEDEVAIYSRALSADEIQTVYNADSAGKCIIPKPPVIITQPAAVTTYQGQTASLSVLVAGSPPMSYQWQFNGSNIVGATNTALNLANAQPSQSGYYSVTASNSLGLAASSNALVTIFPSNACLAPPSAMVSWWEGEGSTVDSVGSNNGTLEAGAGYAPGKVGLAFDFSNGTGYIQVPDAPDLALGSNDFSIELWVNFTAAGNTRAFIAKDDGPGQANKWIFMQNNGVLQFLVGAGPTQAFLGSGTFNSATNQWHHLAVTRIGSLFSFYVDGVLNSTSSSAMAIPSIASPLTIGMAETLYYTGGLEDEVTLYNRGLNAGEVQLIYYAGSAGKCAQPLAPKVVTQPGAQTTYVGNAVTLSITAAGSPPLSYQWQFGGMNIPNATNSLLTLTNVQPGQSGNYSVSITNGLGSTISSNALLTVLSPGSCLPAPAGIVSWWQAEGNVSDLVSSNNGALQAGASYAQGEVGVAFDFSNGTGYAQVPDSPSLALAGDFTIEFWVKLVSPGSTRGFIAKDDGPGNANKWVFLLNNGQLQFLIGNGPSQTFLGSGSYNPTLNQWHHLAITRNGSLFSMYADGVLNSSGTSTAGIPSITAPLTIGMAENVYHLGGLEDEVTIYNRALSTSEIQLIYEAASGGKCGTPTAPILVTQPAGQTNFTGQSVTLSVLASGSPPLNYQWQFNGTNLPGDTTASLALTNIQLSQAGNYSVIVSNAFGFTLSSNAELAIFGSGSCLPPPSGIVSWWQAENNTTDAVGPNNGTLVGGAGYAPGKVGTAFDFSSGGYVEVPDGPSLAFGGNDFTIELWVNCILPGNTRAFVAKDNGQGQQNKWAFMQNNGLLQFLIGNGYISQTFLGSGTFNPALHEWHHLAVTRSGSVLSIYLDGALNSSSTIAGGIPAISAPLTIGMAEDLYHAGGQEDEVTIYNRGLSADEVQAIYHAGSAGKCATPAAPVIITQPVGQTTYQAYGVNLSVLASGSPPLAYQWQFKGSNIAGATATALTLANPQPSQSGNYSVVVSNALGFSTSSNALVTVLRAGSCLPVPPGIVSWWRGEGNASDSVGFNNGTLAAGAGYAMGEVGAAFDFSNGAGYVNIPDTPSLGFGSNDFSIELWVNLTLSGNTRGFIAKDDGPGEQNKWIFLLNNGQLQFAIGNGSTQTFLGSSGFNPQLNQWHHLAVTRHGPIFSFYVDGVLNSTASSTMVIPTISAPLTIGMAENVYYAGGLEDEVTIYDRALSANEVQTTYEAGSTGKCTAPSAPVVITQPLSQYIYVGTTGALEVLAIGSAPLSYQWQLGGTNIPGATSAVLTLSNIQGGQAGNYSVVISNSLGIATTSNALVTVLSSGSCFPLPPGIVSCWRGEGTAGDSVGFNNGTIAGGAGYAAGEVGVAFDFSNGSGYINIPDTPSLAFGASDFSIELWVNCTSPGNTRGFIAKDDGPGTVNKWMFLQFNGQLQFVIGSGSTQTFLGSGSFNPPLNQWHHLAVTRFGELLSFYVDGVLNSTVASAMAIPSITAPLTIGMAENLYYMGGLEDEVTIYDRALSANEVQTIYQAGSAGKCAPESAPLVITQPVSQTVYAGQTAIMMVLAAGGAELNYQWQFNGTNVVGATNAVLTVTNVQPSQSGSSAVLISNAIGSTSSSNALLNVVSPGSCLPVPSGIVSWWRGEGNALDTAGSNSGTLAGAEYGAGNVGLAFDFSNGDGYVLVPDAPDLALGTNDFSIELWVDCVAPGNTRAFIAKDSGQGQQNKWIFMQNNGLLQFLIGNGLSQTFLGSGAFNPALNTWHHLALTRSGSQFATYVDGTLSSAFSSSIAIPSITAPLTIGMAENAYFAGGLEDEVTLYNRGLSATEVQSIFLAGSAGKCTPPTAPTVVAQPLGQTIYTAQSVGLSVEVTGSAPLSYQWQFNGTNIAGATNAQLTLTNIQPAQAGNYSVVVNNVLGFTTSSNALLTVLSSGSCLPVPSGIVSWWRGEGNALDSAGSNPGTLGGGAGYAAGNVGVAFDFSNGAGYVQVPDSPSLNLSSNDFTIELWVEFTSPGNTRGFIAKDSGAGPANKWIFWLNNGEMQFLIGNGSSQLTLGSGAFNPPLNSWHHLAVTRSGVLFSFYVDGALNSVATSTAAIPVINAPLTIGMAENLYFAGGLEDEVTIYGRAFSASEVQSVYEAGSTGKCAPAKPPTIIREPVAETTIYSGGNVELSALATGSPALSYQWHFNNTNIAGATTTALNLTNIQPIQSGTYFVTVSNALGSTNSSAAVVNVYTPTCAAVPGIVGWWAGEGNALDSSGSNHGALVGAVGFAPGVVGQAFVFDGFSQYVNVPDATNLNPATTVSLEAWIYPRDFAPVAAPIIKKAGQLGSQQGGYTLELVGTSGIQFGACLGGGVGWVGSPIAPLPLNQWSHVAGTYDGTNLTLYVNGQEAGAQSFGIEPLAPSSNDLQIGHDPANPDRYFNGLIDEPTVYNAALSAAQVQAIYAAINVGKCPLQVTPSIAIQPQSQSVIFRSNTSFSVLAGGSSPLTYQWRFNGANIPAATLAMLALTNAQSAQAGNYSVSITNAFGSVTSTDALLSILFPPQIASQPMKQSVTLGCPAFFSCSVTGTPPMAYQWLKNGTNIPGETTNSLAFVNVQSSDFANYTLLGSSPYGNVTSSIAALSLDHPPVSGGTIIQRYADGGVRIGVSALLETATDPDGDIVSLLGVNSNSLAGGTINWSGPSVYYLPPAGYTNADAFSYQLTDGHCGGTTTATALVLVRSDNNPASHVAIVQSGQGLVQVIFDGLPGQAYRIQATDTLKPPNWVDVVTVIADQFGSYSYSDSSSTNRATRYYRSVSP